MGRKRVRDNPFQPLPKGLYQHRQQYRARDLNGKWRFFRGSYREVVDAYNAWRENGEPGYAGSVGWLLDYFTGTICPGKVRGQQMAPRTAKDYSTDAMILKDGLGKIPIEALQPHHIATYRDDRVQHAPSHVRNELACLSAAMSYAVQAGYRPENPCLQVKRPSRKRRERLIADPEYLAVYAKAEPSVKLAMLLAVRTLALPSDILRMGAANVLQVGERRILRYRRGKTGALVEMELVGELAAAVDVAMDDPQVRFRKLPFVHTVPIKSDSQQKATPYTRDGIGAMFRRYCEKAGVSDFGLRDLRAKGATDMYRSGVDVRQIQQLLGHGSETMTRTYLKGYISEIVQPNMVPIIAEVK